MTYTNLTKQPHGSKPQGCKIIPKTKNYASTSASTG